jgi:hypothetical protein
MRRRVAHKTTIRFICLLNALVISGTSNVRKFGLGNKRGCRPPMRSPLAA